MAALDAKNDKQRVMPRRSRNVYDTKLTIPQDSVLGVLAFVLGLLLLLVHSPVLQKTVLSGNL